MSIALLANADEVWDATAWEVSEGRFGWFALEFFLF